MKAFAFDPSPLQRSENRLLELLLDRLTEERTLLTAVARKVGLDAPPARLDEERRLLAAIAHRGDEPSELQYRRVLGETVGEVYFQVEMWPGAVIYEGVGGGAAGADALNNFAGVMQLPAMAGGGPASLIYRQCRLRDLWPRTRPRLTIWYTAPGGSTNTFDLRFQLRHHVAGALTSAAGSVVFSTTFTPPGPAVANTILTATVVGGAVMPSLTAPVRWQIARIGGDANANALDILLAVVTLEEVA